MGELVAGPLLIGVPIALLAGLVSFLSPCVLPLVPGYLGYVGALTDGGKAGRARLLLGVSLFILGFMAVFVTMNAVAGSAGLWLVVHRELITRIAGVLVIAVGLVFIGQFSFMQRTFKPGFAPRTGLVGAPLLGVIFGIGWTPCISPTLGAITLLSLDAASPWQGALLGVAYSLGLGIPFVLIALGFGWVATSVAWVKRHIRAINIVGGAMLIAIGLLMLTGVWSLFMSALGAVINVYVTPL